MKMSILKEKCKKCFVFISLKIGGICLFVGFRFFVGVMLAMMVASNAQPNTNSEILPQNQDKVCL